MKRWRYKREKKMRFLCEEEKETNREKEGYAWQKQRNKGRRWRKV